MLNLRKAIVVVVLMSSMMNINVWAANQWTGPNAKTGNYGISTSKITEVDMFGNKFAIEVPEPTPTNGACAGNGAIYMDFTEANAKNFYALSIAAAASNKPVYVEINCQNSTAHLVELQLINK